MLLARDLPSDRAQAKRLLVSAAEQYERLGMSQWLAQAYELSAAV
jgi:hypothetical protein